MCDQLLGGNDDEKYSDDRLCTCWPLEVWYDGGSAIGYVSLTSQLLETSCAEHRPCDQGEIKHEMVTIKSAV